MKIKVLHVTGKMDRGGAETMVVNMLKAISRDQFQFDFLVNYKTKEGIKEGEFDAELIELGSKITHIPSQWDIGIRQYIKQFKRTIEKIGKPDIVHIHMNAKSGVIAKAARFSGIKHVIVHSHANLQIRGSYFYKTAAKLELFFQKLMISYYANHFWGCSPEANKSLFNSALCSAKNIKIINNAIDVESFLNVDLEKVKKLKEEFDLNCDLVLGNIGRIVSHKNIAFIIDLLHHMINHQKLNVKFFFAGRIEQPEYFNFVLSKANKYGISNKVIYLGARDDVPTLMNSMDIFVGPALKEGFGLVAVEAQAARTKCILYTGFPKSVDMDLGLVTFINSFSIFNWINALTEPKPKLPSKEIIANKISQKGFDVVANTKLIENYYKSMLDHKKLLL